MPSHCLAASWSYLLALKTAARCLLRLGGLAEVGVDAVDPGMAEAVSVSEVLLHHLEKAGRGHQLAESFVLRRIPVQRDREVLVSHAVIRRGGEVPISTNDGKGLVWGCD